MTRSSVVSSFAGLVMVLLATPAFADDARFDVSTLSVDGETLAVVPGDLDADGHDDLVVALKRGRSPDEQRYFAIFWNRGGKFSLRPDAMIAVGKDVGAFDVGRVDDRGGAQILTLARDGVSALAFHARRPVPVVRLTEDATLFWKADRGALPPVQVVQDLSAKGSHELLVPAPGQLLIYPRSGARFSQPVHLDLEMKSELPRTDASFAPAALQSFSVDYTFPQVQIGDTDGDGRLDLLVALDDRLWVYRQHAPLVFDGKPSFHRDFDLRTPGELKESFTSASITMRDLDGDGLVDLLLHKQVSHGITSARTVTQLYLGRKGGGYAAEPDQTMKNEGVTGFGTMLADFNGDGHPDLVVPSVSIGVWQIIRILTTKTLKANLQVFAFADRRFSTKPLLERDLKFKVSFSGNSGFQAVDVHGDYNGDHRADLVFGTAEDELGVFPSVAGDGIIAKDPVEKVVVDSRGELTPVDFDHKGKDDLLLYYPGNASHRNEIVVMMNRGGW
jgi:hypothetical protein